MTRIALCIFTNDFSYEISNDPQLENCKYDIFLSKDADITKALRNVSVKKQVKEINEIFDYDICIAYNPRTAILSEIDTSIPIEDCTIYYARGGIVSKTYTLFADFSLFFSNSLDFDRACELYNNLKNINDYRYENLNEKFMYHLRSLHLKSECVNYENSSLFIRAA